MEQTDASAEYTALRAANDRLRAAGLESFWEELQAVCAEANATSPVLLVTARQEWSFSIGKSTMVGERFGVRLRGKTMLVEIGWPREPEHGFVPGNGLARARVSFSLSPILVEKVTDELILKSTGNGDAAWFTFVDGKTESQLTRERLSSYITKLLDG